MRFTDVNERFPLLTGKKTHWNSVLTELLWFCKGLTNVDYLHEHGCTIWDEWADENGDLGPVYGHQWVHWGNQLDELTVGLMTDPYSRRHIVSAWNVSDLHKMKLVPCHMMFQCYVRNNGKLDLMLNQRSADMFLGVPFNIASYAALMHMIARPLNLTPGNLTVNLGAAHIYKNHLTQTEELLNREWPELPRLSIPHNTGFLALEMYEHRDFLLEGYNPLPAIKAPVAI